MEPIHKFNNGRGATLCHSCRTIISVGFTDALQCQKCKIKLIKLLEKKPQEHIDESVKQSKLVVKKKNNHTEKETLELMRQAFEAGFKQADFVEAGLEGKETESIVHWIYLKHINK